MPNLFQMENDKMSFDKNIQDRVILTDNGDKIKFSGFYYIIQAIGHWSYKRTYFTVEFNGNNEVIMYEDCDCGEGWFHVCWKKNTDTFSTSGIQDEEMKEEHEWLYFKNASESDKQFIKTIENHLYR